MKTARYRLSGRQVDALFNLLSNINIRELNERGEIHVVFEDISPEDGKVISDLFYDEHFAKELPND